MKIVATIEARMTSSRLPGKVLMPLAGRPALERMVERVRMARYIDEIVVATTTNDQDEPVEQLCRDLGIRCFRGSEDDVLARVLGTADLVGADLICELTGDCPLIDPFIVDQVILAHLSGNYDYTSNIFNERTYPDGLDVQVFWTDVLRRVDQLTDDPIDRVHVSCYIYHNPKLFRLHGVYATPDQFGPDMRITLDTREDYELINRLFEEMEEQKQFFFGADIVSWLKDNPDALSINRRVRTKALEEG